MQNKNEPGNDTQDLDLSMPKVPIDRRKKARSEDKLYRIMVGINLFAWLALIGALILLHYARPEFITGVQNYWGIDGRDFWSREHLDSLLSLLQVCLLLTILTIILRAKRNRRKTDRFGINLLILLVISVTSLVTIYMTV